ncbi:hypothetical protein ACUT7C_003536 [Vibrio cholerae]|nr:hypothetical protein R4537_01490 [Vibrio paracholerae]
MTIAVVFSYVALASSADPLINLIDSDFYIYAFSDLLPVNSVIFNISIGILISYIFYFLVVFLPSFRAKRLVMPVLVKRISKIDGAVSRMLSDIGNSSGVILSPDSLNFNDLDSALSSVNSYTVHSSFKYYVPKVVNEQYLFGADGKVVFTECCDTLGHRLAHEWSIIKSSKNELISLYGVLPIKSIAVLDLIDDIGFDFVFQNHHTLHSYSSQNIFQLYEFVSRLKQSITKY